MGKITPEVKAKQGAGRPKGSINKATIALRHALEGQNFDVAQKLVQLFNEAKDPGFKFKIARTMLEYTHPRLKDIDIVALEAGEAQPKESTPINISLDELVAIARGDQVE
jgi:hypothetical protein